MLDEEYLALRRGKRLVVKLKRCRLMVDSTTLKQRKDSEKPEPDSSGKLADSVDKTNGISTCATTVCTKLDANVADRDKNMWPREDTFESLDTDGLDLCDKSSETRRKRARLDAIVEKLHQRVKDQLLTNQQTFGDASPLPLNQTQNDSAVDSTKDCGIQSEVPTADQSPVENRVAQTSDRTVPRSTGGMTATLQTDEKVTTWLHKTQELHSKKEMGHSYTIAPKNTRVNTRVPVINGVHIAPNNTRVNKRVPVMSGVQCVTSFRNCSVPRATVLRPSNNPPALKQITNLNQRQGSYLLSTQNGLFSFNNVPLIGTNMTTCSPICAPATITNFINLNQPQRSYLPVATWLPNQRQSNVTATLVYPTSATKVVIPSIVQQCAFPNANFNTMVPPNMYFSF